MASMGVDVDNVIAPTMSAVLSIVAKRHGINANRSEMKLAFPEQNEPLKSFFTKEQMSAIYIDVWKNYRTLGLEDPRIPAILNRIKSRFDIHIITASIANLDNVRDYLRLHEIPFHKFTHTPNSAAKGEINVEVHVDDYHRVAEAYSEKNKKVILLRQPWNEEFIETNSANPNIRHAKDWKDIEGFMADEHRLIAERISRLQRRPLMPVRARFRSRH